MRLSWNEIRARGARFADEWRDAAYEKGETQSFYNAFFEIFGVRRRSVARYEEHVKKLDNRSGFIDLFWPGVLIVEQKSEGRDLEVAYGQAGEGRRAARRDQLRREQDAACPTRHCRIAVCGNQGLRLGMRRCKLGATKPVPVSDSPVVGLLQVLSEEHGRISHAAKTQRVGSHC